MQPMRIFMLVEGALFAAAALVHFGLLTRGYEHQAAGTAESVIAVVLLLGLGSSWIRPQSIRGIAISAQAFAFLGTLVGIFMIAIGIGPRTRPDMAYHVCIVIALISGLVVALRAHREQAKATGR